MIPSDRDDQIDQNCAEELRNELCKDNAADSEVAKEVRIVGVIKKLNQCAISKKDKIVITISANTNHIK